MSRNSLVEIVDTIDLIVEIHCERNPIQTFIANATSEASGMIEIAHGLQNLQNIIIC